jgi:hypothetical protein
MPSKFPSAIRREQASGGFVSRKGPSAAEVAMMDAETFKRFVQSRGEWPDREALGNMQSPDAKGGD